ncbi:hypothetical protein LCGC14_0992930 [marine sediment metagenome]|uniref:Uncharacterized protein n=1 Tax=marine sediment metagenome TaxID=412755 RepID=A0A0F9N583_9ZZZZ
MSAGCGRACWMGGEMRTAKLPADPAAGFTQVSVKAPCVVCDRMVTWRWRGKPYCADHFPSEKYRNRRPRRIECHK